MNVANRKLFANRDARQKLANMGGIMASSPELLGEAQKFAPGGQVTAEQYAVVIPGIADRPIRLNADTLSRLGDLAPQLMQNAIVLDAQTAASQGIDIGKLRPGDLFIERRVAEIVTPPAAMSDMPGMQAPMGAMEFQAPTGPSPVGDIQDPINNLEFYRSSSTIENAPSTIPDQVDPAPVNIGPTELNLPAVRNALRDPNAPSAGLASSLREAAARGPETPESSDRGVSFSQLMSPPQYDMTGFGSGSTSAREPEMTALEALEVQRSSDPRSPEGIRARVAESAQRGMRAGEIANMIGRPIAEVLDIGAGLASAGLLEGTALAADVMSAFQAGVMGNTQAGEFYAGLATNIKDMSDDMYYNEGQVLPRVTAGLDKGPTEAELLEERRKAIESESLRNMSDAMIANDPSLFAEGSVSEKLPGLPESIIQARKGSGPNVPFGTTDALVPSDLDYGATSDMVAPSSDPAVTRGQVSNVPVMDVSTNVPMSPEEAAAANMQLREEGPLTADGLTADGLTPAEELAEQRLDQSEAERKAAEEAALAETLYPGKARTFRAEEERLAGMVEGMTDAEAKEFNKKTRARLESEAAAEKAKTDAAETTKEEPTVTPPPPETGGDAGAGTGGLDTDAIVDTANDPNLSTPDRNAGVSKTVLGGIGVPNADKMGIKDRIKAYESVFKELLGEKDEDKASEMWHNMAMIGFAVAAGESPNALQNISNGLLEGTKMMKEDRATRRKREDAISTMAIEQVLSEDKEARSLANQLKVAAIRGQGSNTYTDQRLRQIIIGNITKNPDLFPGVLKEDGTPDPTKVQTYVDSFITSAGGLDDQLGGGNDDEEMVEVIQNGKKIKVKKSQLK